MRLVLFLRSWQALQQQSLSSSGCTPRMVARSLLNIANASLRDFADGWSLFALLANSSPPGGILAPFPSTAVEFISNSSPAESFVLPK